MLEGSMILSSFFFSDNGIPFPSGKTNLYTTQGQGEPFIMVNPRLDAPPARSQEVVSSLDFVPTILDAAKIEYPTRAKAGHRPAVLTGNSLISSLEDPLENCICIAPVSFCCTCYYPMRSATTGSHRLVHNLNYNLDFGILEDVYNPDMVKVNVRR